MDNEGPLYSNLEYPYLADSELHSHVLPLHQYILEQAKLSGMTAFRGFRRHRIWKIDVCFLVKVIAMSFEVMKNLWLLIGCYRFGDPLNEETDSLHSDDEDRLLRSRPEDDSDEFADDEAMSNQEDSSSQEYLDDSNYLEEEEDDGDDDDDQFLSDSRKYLPRK